MTALERHLPAPAGDLSPIQAWAADAQEAARFAASLARTPFVPQSLRAQDAATTASNITAAILTGRELSLEPMAALRSIDVIQGTPALRAITLRAIVQARGHEIWLAESTKTRAVVRGRRKGSDQVQESVWTIDRAKDLGLVGKSNWKGQPAAMLVARATSECARLIAADAILGVPYSVEELEDGMEAAFTVETPQASTSAPATPPPAKRTAQRRTPAKAPAAARVEDDPDLDDEPPSPPVKKPEPAGDQDGELRTKDQSKKLWTLLTKNGLEDRAAALAYLGGVLHRDVDSTTTLTRAEATRCIDALEHLDDPGPDEPSDW